ncbi:MAG: hypothetical protein IKP40_14060 [Clostridia bacterium]|nr:hypothetical protein [Clostridia bacterium]
MHIPDHGERYHIIRKTFYANMAAYIISSLTSSIGSLIDGVVIGQCLGVESMAAFGLVSPVVVVFSLFGAIIVSGARNRFTMAIGSGDLDGARGIFTLSMLMGVSLSTLLMVLVFAFSTPVCALLGATGSAASLMDKARGYLLGIAIGLPAMNATHVMNACLSIDNDRRLSVIASATLTVVDVVLDLIVAFVMHGDTFEMGLATSISHYTALLVVMLHFRRKERLTRFSFGKIPTEEIMPILGKGLPNGVARVTNTARCVLLNQMMAGMAAAAGCIAAYSVQRQADSLLNGFIFGLTDTVLMLTGILVGEQNRPTLRRMLKTSFRAVWTVVLGISALLFVFSPQFASFFIKDASQEALQYAINATRCFAIGMPIYAQNRILAEYMEGRGETKTAMMLKFFSEGGFIVLSALALFPLIGVDAIWAAFPVSQVLQLLLCAAVIVLQNRHLHLKPTGFWKWYMALPADFDVPKEDRIDRTITSQEQVIELYHAARDFCAAHGCDERRKYLISLSVEELATNTVQTGFRPGKHNTIDMRILKKGDDYILRIRDDCEIFDPVKQLQLYDKDVPLHPRRWFIGCRIFRPIPFRKLSA